MFSRDRQASLPIFLWILIVGGIGFAAGFFGPITLNPDANQGPLLGIFISGPGGAALGVLLYLVCRIWKLTPTSQWQLLCAFCAILSVSTLYFCLPGPAQRGYALELQVQGCNPSAARSDEAIDYWEKRVSEVTWASPRPGWQEDARRRLHSDPAVVLDVMVVRRANIYESKKPWDYGKYSSNGWYPISERKQFYANYAGSSCSDYPVGTNAIDYVTYDTTRAAGNSSDWPPTDLSHFLNLQTLRPVPSEFQKFATK